MENSAVTSKKKFLQWFCENYKGFNEDKDLKEMSLDLLYKNPNAVLAIITKEIDSSIGEYKTETSDNGFRPNNLNQLYVETIEALQKHFLSKNRA